MDKRITHHSTLRKKPSSVSTNPRLKSSKSMESMAATLSASYADKSSPDACLLYTSTKPSMTASQYSARRTSNSSAETPRYDSGTLNNIAHLQTTTAQTVSHWPLYSPVPLDESAREHHASTCRRMTNGHSIPPKGPFGQLKERETTP